MTKINVTGGLELKDSSNYVVSTIQYTVVERSIEKFEQKSKNIVYQLTLDSLTVTSNTHHFQLEHVLDISYKGFSNGEGHLYLHTNQGVFSYVITKDPSEFMNAYKQLKS